MTEEFLKFSLYTLWKNNYWLTEKKESSRRDPPRVGLFFFQIWLCKKSPKLRYTSVSIKFPLMEGNFIFFSCSRQTRTLSQTAKTYDFFQGTFVQVINIIKLVTYLVWDFTSQFEVARGPPDSRALDPVSILEVSPGGNVLQRGRPRVQGSSDAQAPPWGPPQCTATSDGKENCALSPSVPGGDSLGCWSAGNGRSCSRLFPWAWGGVLVLGGKQDFQIRAP